MEKSSENPGYEGQCCIGKYTKTSGLAPCQPWTSLAGPRARGEAGGRWLRAHMTSHPSTGTVDEHCHKHRYCDGCERIWDDQAAPAVSPAVWLWNALQHPCRFLF